VSCCFDFVFKAFEFVWDLDIRYSNLIGPYVPRKKAGPARETLRIGRGAQVMLPAI
jgi:hypothetical protein